MSTTDEVLAIVREAQRQRAHRHCITRKGDRVRVPAHMMNEQDRYEQQMQRSGQMSFAENGERKWSF